MRRTAGGSFPGGDHGTVGVGVNLLPDGKRLAAEPHRQGRPKALDDAVGIRAANQQHVMGLEGLVRTFQLPSEFGQLTVLENLLVAAPDNRGESLLGALLGKRYWMPDEMRLVEQARGLLKRFGMSAKESDYAASLSGGQKRLVEIMRALMLRPRLLLLDEPMSGVHPSIVNEIAGYLEQLRDDGLTLLMVEHELHMVERLCDPVVVMAEGKVIGRGSMAALRQEREVVDAYLVG